jgi:type VI protein secretion system component Hcp
MHKVNVMLIIAIAFLLATPSIALAYKKKGSAPKQMAPQENVTFTYEKIQHTYTQQRTNNPNSRKGN